MKEHPILFSGEMVRAILDGRKTQTRRAVKPQPVKRGAFWEFPWGAGCSLDHMPVVPGHATAAACPYGQPGDRLWVRETWGLFNDWGFCDTSLVGVQEEPEEWSLSYRADHLDQANGDGPHTPVWRPSIHMPRWASRITLEIVSVRVERLQEISEADAAAEGARCADPATGREVLFDKGMGSYRLHFRSIWQSINGPESWAANPWVWCITFRRVEQ